MILLLCNNINFAAIREIEYTLINIQDENTILVTDISHKEASQYKQLPDYFQCEYGRVYADEDAKQYLKDNLTARQRILKILTRMDNV